MKPHLTPLEKKIRASGKTYFENKTRHLTFNQPLVRPATSWWRWLAWGTPIAAMTLTVTVLVAILIAATQPQGPIDQLYTGIYALNQVSLPPRQFRYQSDAFEQGIPAYAPYRMDMDRYYQQTAQHLFTTAENVVYSPYSAYVALSLLLEAADTTTYEALSSLMGVDDLDQLRQMSEHAFIDTYFEDFSDDRTITTPLARSQLANGVFVRDDIVIDPTYLSTLAQAYFAEVFHTAFDAQGQQDIATWMNDKTDNFLEMNPEDLAIENNTVMSLVNTLYVSSQWVKPFLKDANQQKPFLNTMTETTLANVTYMNKAVMMPTYIDHADFILGSDDAYGDHRMIYVLPKPQLQPYQLLAEPYFSIIQAAFTGRDGEQLVNLQVPKTSITNRLDLKENLMAIDEAISVLFDPQTADLSKALPGAYVQSLLQHSRLELFETGVEAAAITIANVGVTSIPLPPEVTLNLNRSFLYFLVNRQGLILFSGVVNQPSW